MKKTILVLVLIFVPGLIYGSTAGDFVVNRQSTYAVPYGTTKVLILDLTLPEPSPGETLQLKSIKIHNAGTADHTVISKMMIWEDGSSIGWDGDERGVFTISFAPFFDREISGDFIAYSKDDPWRRIFVTLDIAANFVLERTIQPQLQVNSVVFTTSTATGPTDGDVVGFERKIVYNAQIPAVPVAPLAKTPEALSTSTIRWHFTDMSNNEFGFKILDSALKVVTQKEEANLSYLDETGLEPGTEYSGRRIVAFNDRGENLGSPLSVFPAVYTLALPVAEEVAEEVRPPEEVAPPTTTEEIAEEAPAEKPISAMTIDELKAKITEVQQKIIELLKQLIQLIQQQIAGLQRL